MILMGASPGLVNDTWTLMNNIGINNITLEIKLCVYIAIFGTIRKLRCLKFLTYIKLSIPAPDSEIEKKKGFAFL